MPNIVSCPSCQKKLRLPDDLLGQDVQCPTCSATFPARTESSSVAPSSLPILSEQEDVENDRPQRHWEDEKDDDDDWDRRQHPRRDFEPHRGSLVLTLGILSLVLGWSFCLPALILGPIAWIMGNNDVKAIRDSRMDPDGEGTTNAGRICGMIATILGIVGLLLVCGYFVLMLGLLGAAKGGQRF